MARKKRHHKKTSRRRRSHKMSGFGGGQMTEILSMVAGAVAGRVLQNKLGAKFNPKLVAGGQMAVGYFLPKFVKNSFVKGIGTGMIINGGVTLVSQFGVVSAVAGIGEDIVVERVGYEEDSIAGSSDINVIAGDFSDMGLIDEGVMSGSSDISILAGDGEFDEMDY